MKRNNLTTALLAGLAGAAGLASSANALNLNPDGLGQALVYPYYTVNKNNATVISVVNTTNRVKAVKVRFLEGRNSKEVLDFNLYLSPFDVWTAGVTAAGSTGAARLTVNDNSCTAPILAGTIQPFLDFEYTGANRDYSSNTPSALAAALGSIERTREGHIEVIEMGVLQTGTMAAQLGDEATHNSAGVPSNCAALVNAWLPSGVWTANRQAGIDVPSGGLYGAGTIVDVANGTLHAYNADAIEGFYTNATQPGFLHFNPGTIDPDLGDADNGGGNIAVNIFTGNGTLVTRNVAARAKTLTTNGDYSYDAASLAFMHDAIYNEYVSDPTLGASSEWVITFPTKEAYVDVPTNAQVRPPFTNSFFDNGSACENVTINYWDREERTQGTPPGQVIVSPPPPTATPNVPALCYEAQVVTFNQSAVGTGSPSAIFGSTYAFNLATTPLSGAAFTSGWAQITFDDPTVAGNQNVLNNAGGSFIGLPVTGFWSVNFVNRNSSPGILANYSGAYAHRASRR